MWSNTTAENNPTRIRRNETETLIGRRVCVCTILLLGNHKIYLDSVKRNAGECDGATVLYTSVGETTSLKFRKGSMKRPNLLWTCCFNILKSGDTLLDIVARLFQWSTECV